ncbi:KH domain-containing protein / zinc finger (CCCH type) family protein [Rhynchospora pubera]|uniref:KH domain-containing protein / zinc finger (CCCH type) family protein n=1 Tax=Rhynchospora pubera TaxID=906938 RepID=A0AAV8E5P6_9POAL|nr:KH domain-containing protein / zinc finger (CCCH type) family protein [Rhynchospora pubera]
MSEIQTTNSNLSRDDDSIVLSEFEIPRLESIKTDRSRSDPASRTTSPKTLTPTPTNPDIFFKTRLCANFSSKGYCGYGDACTFAHGAEELRNMWDARFRVCNMYLKHGRCTYGSNCSYVHAENDREGFCAKAADRKGAGPGPGFYKSNPCFNWKTTGRCSYGSSCRFVHGGEDAKVEAEGGHKIGVLEGSSRSRSIFSFKPIALPSRQKKGSEKLKELKKINGIYGDWPDEICQIDNCF